MDTKELEYEVWRKAAIDFERDVMARTATLVGGKRNDETTLDYARRSREEQKKSMQRLEYAQVKLRVLLEELNGSY